MANKSKQGYSAGQTVRSKVNTGARTAVNASETVFTALKGFVFGVLASEPKEKAPRKFKVVQRTKQPAKAKPVAKAKPAKAKAKPATA